MAAPMESDFERWLSKRLLEINPDVDLDVFVPYIHGILEDDLPEDEQQESIVGIISQITEDDLEATCQSIQNRWKRTSQGQEEEKEIAQQKEKETLDTKLASMMQKQSLSVVKSREISAEEKARKAAILAQYARLSDDEEGADDPGGGDAGEQGDKQGAAASMGVNLNSSSMDQREKELRDNMKVAHEAKKAKDKDDRQKQKQKAQDRKEGEKKRTQKGERRR